MSVFRKILPTKLECHLHQALFAFTDVLFAIDAIKIHLIVVLGFGFTYSSFCYN